MIPKNKVIPLNFHPAEKECFLLKSIDKQVNPIVIGIKNSTQLPSTLIQPK